MFNVKIVHISDRVLCEGSAQSVCLPGVQGEFEVRNRHIAIVSLLGRGEILVTKASADLQSVEIFQGIMHFNGNELFAVVE